MQALFERYTTAQVVGCNGLNISTDSARLLMPHPLSRHPALCHLLTAAAEFVARQATGNSKHNEPAVAYT